MSRETSLDSTARNEAMQQVTVENMRYKESMWLGEGLWGIVYQGQWNDTGFEENHDKSQNKECAIKVLKLTKD